MTDQLGPDDVQASHKGTLDYVSLVEHVGRAFQHHWKPFALAAVYVFGVVWSAVGASALFLEVEFSGWQPYLGVIGLSLLGGLSVLGLRYLGVVPEDFQQESREAQRLAHLQPERWRFKLARRLLHDRLTVIDRQLSDVVDGLQFVPIRERPDVERYVDWLRLRPTNLVGMVGVAKQLVVFDLPAALLSNESGRPSPQEILRRVERIETLYRQIYEFQIEGHSIEPPDGFNKVHEIQQRWALVISDGIQQMFDFFDEIVAVDLKGKDAKVEFTVEFREPGGIEEFNAELERLERALGP